MLCSGLNDADIGLMRYQHINIFIGQAGLFEGFFSRFAHNFYGELKYFVAVHMYGMFFGVNGFVAGRFSAAACGLHKVNASCAVTAKVKAKMP